MRVGRCRVPAKLCVRVHHLHLALHVIGGCDGGIADLWGGREQFDQQALYVALLIPFVLLENFVLSGYG